MSTTYCKSCLAEKPHPFIPHCLKCGCTVFLTLTEIVGTMSARILLIEKRLAALEKNLEE